MKFFVFVLLVFSFSLKANVDYEKEINKLLTSMTVEEKVGQIMMVEISHITPEEVKDYSIGAILNGGGSFPYGKKNHSIKDWQNLADEYFNASKSSRIGVPVIWGTDAVHGHNNLKGAVLFPHNIGLGATGNTALVREISEIVAKEVYLSGLDLTFAPAVSVPRNDLWGRTYEGFSENPQSVAELGKVSVEGYQGKLDEDFLANGRILATSKHFIGDGGTLNGVDKGNTVLNEEDLIQIHGQGYISTIEAGVQLVMASFNSWNGEKLHGYKYLLTDVLKEQTGFDGIVVGDWNGHQEVEGCYAYSCAQTINAGLDMFMVTDSWKRLYKNTLNQVVNGEIAMQRLDDAVRRILRVKLRYDLLNKKKPSLRESDFPNDFIGSPAHRDIARQAVRESLVLLKNNERTLPADPSKKIMIVGKGAKDISKATGGWSFTWQGTGNNNSNFPGATSIFAGLESLIAKNKGTVTYSENGAFSEKPDLAILVIGENPYAEYQGSINSLEFINKDFNHLKAAESLQAQNIPVVFLFLSGRPMWVNKELNRSDAFIAAWLPGTEGGGVAEVIFGQSEEGNPIDFVGKLPFSWPKEADDSSLNEGDAFYDPLFPFGYGLTYKDDTNIALLSETLPKERKLKLGEVLLQGWPTEKFRVILQSPTGALVVDKKYNSSQSNEISSEIVDGKVQEDTHRIIINKGTSGWFLTSSNPMNLVNEEQASGILTFDFKLIQDDKEPLVYTSVCGQDCNVSIDMSEFLGRLEVGRWTTVGIPLKCLKRNGLDLQKVTVPLGLISSGTWSFDMGKIYLEGGEGGKHVFPCK